jgi:hypothetical protein
MVGTSPDGSWYYTEDLRLVPSNFPAGTMIGVLWPNGDKTVEALRYHTREFMSYDGACSSPTSEDIPYFETDVRGAKVKCFCDQLRLRAKQESEE